MKDDIMPRLTDVVGGCKRTGLGRNRFREWARKIGAERSFGRRKLFDLNTIDEELDRMAEEAKAKRDN